MDWTLPANITLDLSGYGCNGSEGVLYISQSSRTGASPLDGLGSLPGQSLVCVCVWGSLTPLQRCSWHILQP